MEFDLFTFIAQMINFLILLFLLNKFIFGRIKAAMKERERKIRDNIQDAEKKNISAGEYEDKNRELYKKISDEKESLINQAKLEAESFRERLIDEYKTSAAIESEKQKLYFNAQNEKFLELMKHKSREYVFLLSEKIIRDLADEKLENKICEKFIKKIKVLESDMTDNIRSNLVNQDKLITVKSSFELDQDLRIRIMKAFNEKFKFTKEFNFEINNGDFCGIELVLESYVISWNMDQYLSGIGEKLFPMNKV
jgi:F-type H+-transporting ATPase subunit b